MTDSNWHLSERRGFITHVFMFKNMLDNLTGICYNFVFNLFTHTILSTYFTAN